MSRIEWDKPTERLYETGVDHCVLYPMVSGAYGAGVAWNGITAVNESPSGAEATAFYADNIEYVSLQSAEKFGGTIEAFMWPDEFAECDGSKDVKGVTFGQQPRKPFGLSYRTILGNDTDSNEYGYKLHLVYNALAAPSERAYATINDSPEAITFSWEFTTTPISVSDKIKNMAIVTINSTTIAASALAEIEDILYGTTGESARMILPEELLTLVG